MIFRRFSVIIFIQIILIAVVGTLFLATVTMEYMQMTTIGLMLLWAGQIFYLNYYIGRTTRDIRRFLDSLRNQDTSLVFNNQTGGQFFREIYDSFNKITKEFRLVRIEKEVENRFFKEMISQSASGIIAISENHEVRFINKTALDLLGLEELRKLQELKQIHKGIYDLFTEPEGEKNRDVKIHIEGKTVQIAVTVSYLILDGSAVKIFSLLDISREMARSEIEAWQKLIRVLNHEITNSVSPIHLLSTSLLDLFMVENKPKAPQEINNHIVESTILGLKTIMKRSSGLASFINSYRSFTNTGKPDLATVSIADIFNNVILLLTDEIKVSGVEVVLEIIPDDLNVTADEKLMEQTLINLLKNSLNALEERDNPSISLKGYLKNEHVTIEITDNGRGIPEEIIGNVYTPFFTTRKDGSGIGLTLARQIMQMHNGSINVESSDGEYTRVTLAF